MNYDIGKRIRELRLQNDLTQEQLAARLNLSAQSVSKWENNVSLPDIQLLPELSALLGVSIDALFSLSGETRFARIERMLEAAHSPSASEYDAAEAFLEETLAEPRTKGRALSLLANLNNHRASSFRRRATHYAKAAIAFEPAKRKNHSYLCEAFGGVLWDWGLTNHHDQIAYYRDFVASHPDYQRGYLWLMENLLADRRLDEAGQLLARMPAAPERYRIPLYQGYIAAAKGDMAEADRCWARMVEDDPKAWIVWAARGDACARHGRYDEAIENYQKSIPLQPKPRLIDNHLCLAVIREIRGEWTAAADMYARIIAILRDDWEKTEGVSVEQYQQKLAECHRRAGNTPPLPV